MSFGEPELTIISLLSGVLAFVVLWNVAGARRQSKAYALWALLGLWGLVIGLLMMIAMTKRQS